MQENKSDTEKSDPDDALFDPIAVEAGAWSPGPYGEGDSLGSYNEVDSGVISAALALLDLNRPLRTFDLGHRLYTGFPSGSGREYRAQLIAGEFPSHPTKLTHMEDRIEITTSLGSRINGLHHTGVGQIYYGGRQYSDIVEANGEEELDTPTWGPPLVTRGMLIDVVGTLAARGQDSALSTTDDGQQFLARNYRVTIEDLESAITRQRLPPFRAGDAILIFTGWSRDPRLRPLPEGMTVEDMAKGIGLNPGVWLRECRWLASFRPALLGADAPGLATDRRDVAQGALGACYQELLVKHGVRVAEHLNLAELVDAGVDRFVFCHNPLRATGSVGSNTPAFAIANV